MKKCVLNFAHFDSFEYKNIYNIAITKNTIDMLK